MTILKENIQDFKKYTDILRIEKCKEIMDAKEVVVTEKIHGSNFRIKVTKEGLILGSRNLTLDGTNDNFSQFMPIFEALDHDKIIAEFVAELIVGSEVIIFGEVFGAGYAKGCTYKDVHAFRVFDIFINNKPVDYDELEAICIRLGLVTTPFLYRGKPDYELFLSLIGKSNLTVEQDTGEGIVIKAYGHYDRNGRPLFAKMVSERFAEAKSVPVPISAEKMAEREVCQLFAETYVTEGRINKMIAQLKEANIYTGEMQDMKNLIPALWKDLEKEESDVLEILYNKGINKKSINGACTKLLGKIYATMQK